MVLADLSRVLVLGCDEGCFALVVLRLVEDDAGFGSDWEAELSCPEGISCVLLNTDALLESRLDPTMAGGRCAGVCLDELPRIPLTLYT